MVDGIAEGIMAAPVGIFSTFLRETSIFAGNDELNTMFLISNLFWKEY